MIAAEEIDGRLARFQAALAAGGMDAAVIVESTDLAYLTGTNQQAHLIVPASGRPRLLVRRTLERAREESPLELIEPLGSLSGLPAALAGCGVDDGALVGFELDVLPAARYLGYQRRLPGYRLGDCSQALRSVRAVKTGWELERMRAAAEQVRVAAERVPSLLRAGVSEATVQAEVERVLRGRRPPGTAAVPRLQPGDALRAGAVRAERRRARLLRLAAVRAGAEPGAGQGPRRPRAGRRRSGDRRPGRRPPGLPGRPDAHVRARSGLPPTCARAYDRAVEILRAVEPEIRPGHARPARCSSWPSSWPSGPGWASTSWATATGRIRFLGHGVGMEIDELPVLAPGFDEPMVEGNVIAVEPKFVFPGRGAVGIENMYAVTADGFETITTAAEELIES